MLEALPIQTVRTDLIRLASPPNLPEFLQEQGLDDKGIGEASRFLDSRGIPIRPEDLVDQAFKAKPRLAKTNYATRFSNGSFPVLYGALQAKTAEAEVKHWFSKQISGRPNRPRTAWYMRFAYRFSGNVKDLRPRQTEWPALTHDNDYGFCNELGAEAAAAGLDGLWAPSARNKGGTNLPALTRQAVSNFSAGEAVSVTYDPKTRETSLRDAVF